MIQYIDVCKKNYKIERGFLGRNREWVGGFSDDFEEG